MAMRRFNLGIWGWPISLFRKIVLTTREGNDNTTKVFTRDLRKLISRFRAERYEVEYNGAFELTPGKGLLHWHGILRIKGGYFPITRRMLGDMWNEIHGAFVVLIETIDTGEQLKEYILKDIMKQYLDEAYIDDNFTRNKFLTSRGWMRKGWKEVEGIAKAWVLAGLDLQWMDREKWSLVNEIMLVWAEKREAMLSGKMVDGKVTGHLYMEMGRIFEAVGGAVAPCDYEYYGY